MKHKKKYRLYQKKLMMLGIFFTLVIGGLFARVAYIQTVYGNEYERKAIEQASNQQSMHTVITAQRGSIFDRNGQVLAGSYAVDNIILDISEMVKESQRSEKGKKSVEDTVANLSKFLEIPVETINGYLQTDANGVPLKDVRYFILKKEVDRKVTEALMASGVKCVYTEEVSKRTYPGNNLASAVLGFMRGDVAVGLEGQYNKALSGVNGRIFKAYASNIQTADASVKDDAVNGYSLVTTIDMAIQQYAEEAVRTSSQTFKCSTTAIVVMNPKTGEILAMAQSPSFNSNDPANIAGIDDLLVQEALSQLPKEEQITALNPIWTNFSVTKSFEPGSIYKPILVATALEEGLISPTETFFCGGFKMVNDKRIGCHYRAGHGTQTLTQALANSCNVAMMDIAEKTGGDIIYRYHSDFGFGQKTGIDLPSESALSGLQYSKSQLEHPLNLATYSFGQGFNATAIQDITAFSALINGGNVMKPYVVTQVVDESGRVVQETEPTVLRRVISKDTSNFMMKSLQSVVTPEGTGRKAAIAGYAIGGKTGTAQQGVREEDESKQDYTLSFIAYMPGDDPDIIALAIMNIDQPNDPYTEGTTSPAPMMKELLLNIIKYRGLLPTGEVSEEDNIHLSPDSQPLNHLVGSSLSSATRYLNDSGLDYEIIGSGDTVESQMPNSGAMVAPGDKVYLYIMSGEASANQTLVLVPKVTDMPVEQAEELLSGAGLVPFVAKNPQANVADAAGDVTTAIVEADPTATPATETADGEEGVPLSGLTVTNQMPTPGIRVQAGTVIRLRAE